MTELADTITVGADLPDKKEKLRRRVGIAAGLGAVAAVAYVAQHTGLTQKIPDEFWRGAAESMAHPVVGYVGALVGVALADRRLRRRPPQLVSAFVGGTVANFGIEALQDGVQGVIGQIQGSEVANNFLNEGQSLETPKDYAFAVGGVAILTLSERIRTK